MLIKGTDLWKKKDDSMPYVIGGPEFKPKKMSHSNCLRKFCYWSVVAYAVLVTYLLAMVYNEGDVSVLQVYNIKTYLVSKFTILQYADNNNNDDNDANYENQVPYDDIFDAPTSICELIYTSLVGWLYNINEEDLKDKPLSMMNTTTLEAYKSMIKDMCRDANDDSCYQCFLGDASDQTQYSDQEQFNRLQRCTKAHNIPANYNHFKHYVLDQEDDYRVTFSEIMSACLHTMPEYLRGFSTTGINTVLKNDILQDQYTLRKWVARALISVGFISDQISHSEGGLKTFLTMKDACKKVRDSGVMDKLFEAAMFGNPDNHLVAQEECKKTYAKL